MLEEKKFYLTKKGAERIKKEYKNLKLFKFSKAKGEPLQILDLESLIFLNKRIAELENILGNSQLIKVPPKRKRNLINLGATVEIEMNEDKDKFTVVGTLEANPSLGKISNESPLGKALLGHKVGDEIVLSSPIKTIYKIKKIKYYSQ